MIRINLLNTPEQCEPCLAEKASCAAELLRFRSGEAGNPVERVMHIAARLSLEMGLTAAQRDQVQIGALLHDIGKLKVPDAVLEKAGPLTDEEWEIMRQHTINGGNELARLGFPREVRHVAYHHHEKWDGSGYPGHLAGERIPFTARIVTIADAYDAMRSVRCYKGARTHQAAIDELVRCSGSQFDPAIVNSFVRIPEKELAC